MMTLALVVSGFPYTADGVAVRWLAAGTTADIRADLLAGLVEAGTVTLEGASSLASGEPEATPDVAGPTRRRPRR
jgi:hypothetical protein